MKSVRHFVIGLDPVVNAAVVTIKIEHIGSKHQKEFMADFKRVYKAVNKELAESELDILEDKCHAKYPIVIKSWRSNWGRLSQYFKFPYEIRRIIYTTNTIEAVHRQLAKTDKNQGCISKPG